MTETDLTLIIWPETAGSSRMTHFEKIKKKERKKKKSNTRQNISYGGPCDPFRSALFWEPVQDVLLGRSVQCGVSRCCFKRRRARRRSRWTQIRYWHTHLSMQRLAKPSGQQHRECTMQCVSVCVFPTISTITDSSCSSVLKSNSTEGLYSDDPLSLHRATSWSWTFQRDS